MQLPVESNGGEKKRNIQKKSYWRLADCVDGVTGLLFSLEPVGEGAGGATPAIEEPRPSC